MTTTTIQPWEVKRQQVREFSDWCAITGRDPLEEAVREHIETLEAASASPRAFLESFWPGQEITADAILAHRHSPDHEYGYLESIRGRMLAENAVDDSDAEIERTLSPCVAGELLVNVAKFLRDEGVSLLPPPTPSILYNLNFAYEASSDAEALEIMREGTYQEAGCVLRVAGDGRCVGGIDPDSVGPFPAEPAFNSPEAVAQAAETIRAMHTPGPWAVQNRPDLPAWHVASPTGLFIAGVHREPGNLAETQANARLIAAAPELADAASRAVDRLADFPRYLRAQGLCDRVLGDIVEESLEALRAALAKAGRS